MKFKNNWDAMRPSKQHIKAMQLIKKQKKLTAEELFEESEKAYAAMLAKQVFEARKNNIKLKDKEK